MAFDISDFKALKEFQRRHGLTPAAIEQLLADRKIEPKLVNDLLDLAYTKYRTLASWGGKAEFSREVERIISKSAEDGSGEDA
jgi:hypothetical protein